MDRLEPVISAHRAYHRGNVAEDMMAAAQRILAEERMEDVTARRLCREVGVTPGNFYNHFESRESLLLDIAADGFASRQTKILVLLASDMSRAEKLLTLSLDLVEFARANFQLYRVMFDAVDAGGNPRHDRALAASRASFAALVEMIYGDDRYQADTPAEIAWSHRHCREAYAFFAFVSGLARSIAQDMITFADEQDHVGFASEVTRQMIERLIGPIPDKPRRPSVQDD